MLAFLNLRIFCAICFACCFAHPKSPTVTLSHKLDSIKHYFIFTTNSYKRSQDSSSIGFLFFHEVRLFFVVAVDGDVLSAASLHCSGKDSILCSAIVSDLLLPI